MVDWQAGMNYIVADLEAHLDQPADLDRYAKLLCCSGFEFSRIFSFVAGVSLSEYLRRRRLSRAAQDLQSGKGKVLDIALRYGYESQSAFSRAFRELHAVSPSQARNPGVQLKNYPKLSFLFQLKGVTEMNYRIVSHTAFQIIGCAGLETGEPQSGDSITPIWRKFMDHYNMRLATAPGGSYYQAPFWQVGAYWLASANTFGGASTIVGAELAGRPVLDGMDVKEVPASTWAVFTYNSASGFTSANEAFARIFTEWLPQSGYRRNEALPSLDVYPDGDASSPDYEWEIWVPVLPEQD